MSHRESRDSDSKRHRSRLDREPSPKRSRRDGKQMAESDKKEQEQKHSRRLQDGSPLESPLIADSKPERESPNKDSERKPKTEHDSKKRPLNPTEFPRSRSYYQHDERSYAAQIGRSSGRAAAGERRWWRDSRDKQNDRVKREEKGNWRHDKFFEIEVDNPPTRKRPAFREKKIVEEDSENANRTDETVKSANPDRATEERREEERSRNGRLSDRSVKPFAGDRALNRREPFRGGFPSRDRYHRSGGDANYRGRDRIAGRPGFHAGGARVDKWKHDLYQESNRSPTPKNEEDQIAKVEALLAS